MKSPGTLGVHPSSDGDKLKGSSATAIFPSAAYNYMDGELQYPGFYSTYNQKRLGQIMANLEQGNWGMVLVQACRRLPLLYCPGNACTYYGANLSRLISIGKLVFNALNKVEWAFAIIIGVSLFFYVSEIK